MRHQTFQVLPVSRESGLLSFLPYPYPDHHSGLSRVVCRQQYIYLSLGERPVKIYRYQRQQRAEVDLTRATLATFRPGIKFFLIKGVS